MAEDIAILMLVPGIEGESTLRGTDPGTDGSHERWIPISSCSFTLSRPTTAADPSEESDAVGTPSTSVDPIEIERSADITTADILTWLASTEVKTEVKIDYCTRSGRYFLRYVLKNVQVVSSRLSFKAPDDLVETLTLIYEHITILQRPIDVQGDVQTEQEGTMEYDVFLHE